MVEAHFITTHGADASAIFRMKWRKFRILVDAVFSSGAVPRGDKFDINAAFDKAQGKAPADSTTKMDLGEFIGQM